jgi:hypothetical protein
MAFNVSAPLGKYNMQQGFASFVDFICAIRKCLPHLAASYNARPAKPPPPTQE